MIKLNVSAANIAVEEKETLTEGRVGLLCRFSFTGEWDGLAKTAVFDGADSRDVILTEDTVAVPAECLAAEGCSLSVGVYGKNAAGDIVIPTVYATVGKIQRSAWPSGKETAPPTPDVVAQIQQAAANAEAMARAVREDAELGKFKGEPGEHGGWYTPAVTQPDENTMRVAFTPSKEGMPAVPPKDITIPGGGGITVDDTMTVSGAAADAKAVGDAINSLSEEKVSLPKDTEGNVINGTVGWYATSDGAGGITWVESAPSGGGGSGDDGGYYAPAVDADGNLSWTASKADMPAVDGANIKGQKGADGKSAYAYAVDGGYTGTEEEFAAKLAQEPLTGSTSELTPTQVYNAVSAGIPVKVQYTDSTYGLITYTNFNVAENLNVIAANIIAYYNGEYIVAELFGDKTANAWGFMMTNLAQKTDIPTDEHINSLIDTKLGVIENGAY